MKIHKIELSSKINGDDVFQSLYFSGVPSAWCAIEALRKRCDRSLYSKELHDMVDGWERCLLRVLQDDKKLEEIRAFASKDSSPGSFCGEYCCKTVFCYYIVDVVEV